MSIIVIDNRARLCVRATLYGSRRVAQTLPHTCRRRRRYHNWEVYIAAARPAAEHVCVFGIQPAGRRGRVDIQMAEIY